jgi:hypothetical protein
MAMQAREEGDATAKPVQFMGKGQSQGYRGWPGATAIILVHA